MREALVVLPSSSSTPPHLHRQGTTAKPKPKFKLKPKQKPSHLTSQSPLFSTLRWNSNASQSLKYYAELASKLAQNGRFNDSLMIAESVVVGVNNADVEEFVDLLNVKSVSDGIVRLLDEGKLWSVVELLIGSYKLGIDPMKLIDGTAMNAISKECRRIMECGEVEEVVSLMETLKGCGMPIKDLVRPYEIIRLCVSQRKPTVAVRYSYIFPHADIMFCTIILEFGKKGDLASALTVFESSNQNQDAPNLYIYRSIIDVCGLCGDYLKARSIYECRG